MTVISRVACFSLMMSLICFAGLMSAQSPDQEQNLFACKNGWDSCDRSALTQADKDKVTAASVSIENSYICSILLVDGTATPKQRPKSMLQGMFTIAQT